MTPKRAISFVKTNAVREYLTSRFGAWFTVTHRRDACRVSWDITPEAAPTLGAVWAALQAWDSGTRRIPCILSPAGVSTTKHRGGHSVGAGAGVNPRRLGVIIIRPVKPKPPPEGRRPCRAP
jgi:hypothetical protein